VKRVFASHALDVRLENSERSTASQKRVTISQPALSFTAAEAANERELKRMLNARPLVSDRDPATSLGRAERAILTVLAQFPSGRTRQQVATLSGYSNKSSGFANSLSKLRVMGLIDRGDPIRATDDGLATIAGQYEPLPIGTALLHHWNSKLGRAERTILGVVIEAWPASLTREEVAERSDYSPTSSGFANALSKLRTLELISGRGDIVADETLAREVKEQ
jgi:hypothetical protein